MAIWFKQYPLEQINQIARNTLMEHLGIEIVEVGEDYLRATMPVDHRTVQPEGILHGGASVALAESLGSFASVMTVNPAEKICVGIEINANHLRTVRSGTVTGEARPLHLGKRIQVWEIKIYNEENKLVCVSRLTMAVIDRQELADKEK